MVRRVVLSARAVGLAVGLRCVVLESTNLVVLVRDVALGASTATQVSKSLLETKPLGQLLQTGDPLSHVTKMFGLVSLIRKTEPSFLCLQAFVGPVNKIILCIIGIILYLRTK